MLPEVGQIIPAPASDATGQTTPLPQQTLEQSEGPAEPEMAAVIPGYRLKQEIACGGMGIVYAAECVTFGREVAVKVMRQGHSVAVFNREARITARLPHPGIPPIHSLGTLTNGRPYLVMKLIRGETLDNILKKRVDLLTARGKLIAVFEQICQAVGYAHSQGIIHRDLKPANVMVGAFGEVQVMDWGLAREVRGADETTSQTLADDAGLTVAGQVKGTPAYMAPEQARGEEVDARADVFALGGILAAILTGQPPFSGDSVMQTIARAAKCDLNDTLGRLDDCGADPELISLCRECLRESPADRPLDGVCLSGNVAKYRADVDLRLLQAERDRAAGEAKAMEQENTRREAQEKFSERLARKRMQLALVSVLALLAMAGGCGSIFWMLWGKAERNHKEALSARKVAEGCQGAD